MNPDFLPVRAFLTRADADIALRLLEASGISSRLTSELGGDSPFMLVVVSDHHAKAIEILQRQVPPASLCERCGKNSATIHLTMIVDGHSTTANFCQRCYDLPRG